MSEKGSPCLVCKEQQQKPKYGEGVRIVYDPGIVMPGTPTIEDTRLSAEWVAGLVHYQGMQEAANWYPHLKREHFVTACWWVGEHGPRHRKLTKALRGWALTAGQHLWYQCFNFPDPPTAAALAPAPGAGAGDGQ